MDDQVRELVALGKEHFHRGDYSLAAGHLEQVVARGAAFADVHHMLGIIYHHLGEFESAQKAFQKALEINPNYVEAALNLAITCNDLGQYERAQQVYGNALARARTRQVREPNGDEPLDTYTRGKIANLHAAVADGYLSVRRPNDAAANAAVRASQHLAAASEVRRTRARPRLHRRPYARLSGSGSRPTVTSSWNRAAGQSSGGTGGRPWRRGC